MRLTNVNTKYKIQKQVNLDSKKLKDCVRDTTA